jgi:hypothetical protein
MTTTLADPVVQCALHVGFALLFASAARHKWRDPRGFRRALDDYALLPARAVPVATAGLIALESGVALALLVPGAGAVPALTGSALLLLYGAAMAVNLWRGRAHIDCGCGPRDAPIGPGLVLRNAGLAALLAAAALPAVPRALGALDALHVAAALGTGVLLYGASEQLLSFSRTWRNPA